MYNNKQYTYVVVRLCTIPQYEYYMNGWQASNLAADISASVLVTSECRGKDSVAGFFISTYMNYLDGFRSAFPAFVVKLIYTYL